MTSDWPARIPGAPVGGEPDFGEDNSDHDTDCDCKACLIDTWHAEVNQERAEVERLREALRKIRDGAMDGQHGEWWYRLATTALDKAR